MAQVRGLDAKPSGSEDDKTAEAAKTRTTDRFWPVLSMVAMALAICTLILVPMGPMRKYRDSNKELRDLRRNLELARETKAFEELRLQSQEKLVSRLNARKRDFDLWSFLDRVLKESNLKDRAVLDNKAERASRSVASAGIENVSLVKLSLSGVTLDEIVKFLHAVYASNNLVVMYRLEYLRAARDGKGLECSVTFLSPKPKPAGSA